MKEAGNKGKSSHILNTSSNLLGFCFIVLTSMHAFHFRETSVIDELTAVSMVLFMASSLLSFLSIRSETARSERWENWADTIFLIGLICLFITTMLVVLGIIA